MKWGDTSLWLEIKTKSSSSLAHDAQGAGNLIFQAVRVFYNEGNHLLSW